MVKVLLVEASEIDARRARDMRIEAREWDIQLTHVGNLSAAVRLLAVSRSMSFCSTES